LEPYETAIAARGTAPLKTQRPLPAHLAFWRRSVLSGDNRRSSAVVGIAVRALFLTRALAIPDCHLQDWCSSLYRVAAEKSSRRGAYALNFRDRRHIPGFKHRRLDRRAGAGIFLPPTVPRGLDDKVDVRRLPSRVRPKANVNLVGLGDNANRVGYALEQRSKLRGLGWGQIPYIDAVPKGLDD
jgi:hypothetical protein